MQKQIEEMVNIMCHGCSRKCDDTSGCIVEDYAEAIYNEGYRKQEWISVEERLPESGVHCLLCCDIKCIDGTHRQYVCDGYHAERWKEECSNCDGDCAVEYNEEDDEYYLCEGWYEVIKNWDDYSSIAIADTITHWMPLPEAPKMKGGAEE